MSSGFQVQIRHKASSKHKALEGCIKGIEHSTGGSQPQSADAGIDDMQDDEVQAELVNTRDLMEAVDSTSEAGDEDEKDDNDGDDIDIDWGLVMEVDTASHDYTPFPSKLFALLFILLNSPRPLGESNLKFVWYLVKQCDPSIPSMTQVKSFTLPSLLKPVKYYSPQGVPFHVNTPSDTLTKCIGNPEIANMLQRYPVERASVMSEVWHGRRWRNDPLYQAPMVEIGTSQVFMADFISVEHPQKPHLGGVIAKVLRLYMKEGLQDIFASVEVLLSLDQFCSVCPQANVFYCDMGSLVQHHTHEINVSNISATVQPPSLILQWDPSSYTLQRMSLRDYSNYIEPHPLKAPAQGRPVVVVPLIVYSDDTSGNKSKKWNKFDCWCFLCAGLPHHENAKLHNIHFITCSNEVSALDMANALVADFRLLEQGVGMYDAHLQKEVLVVAPILLFLGDNPRHSELLNHLGGAANKYCRMCMVDRNESPTEIAALRTKELALSQMEDIADIQSERGKQARRTQYGLKEDRNLLFTLSVDIFRSAPVETLHTILLGPYKYLLKAVISAMNAREKKEVLARMAAFNYSGFDGKVLGNVVYHHQSFVGRDYKAWAQMALFIIGNYIDASQKQVWLGLSKVFRIVYCLPFSEQTAHEY